MLVCNVSLSRRRAAIAADVAEAAVAADQPGTGNVVFATLVDDPANVRDSIDAYLGEIMREAASASSTVNAGLVYRVAVAEAVTAADALSSSSPGVFAAAVVEAASAADLLDATQASRATRSAMIIDAAVNYTTQRQANVNGVMTNL